MVAKNTSVIVKRIPTMRGRPGLLSKIKALVPVAGQPKTTYDIPVVFCIPLRVWSDLFVNKDIIIILLYYGLVALYMIVTLLNRPLRHQHPFFHFSYVLLYSSISLQPAPAKQQLEGGSGQVLSSGSSAPASPSDPGTMTQEQEADAIAALNVQAGVHRQGFGNKVWCLPSRLPVYLPTSPARAQNP